MQKEFSTRIKLKRDTQSNWETANPVLLSGEIISVVIDSTETRLKVGDGVTQYLNLPFIADTTSETWTFTLDDGTTVTKNVVVK